MMTTDYSLVLIALVGLLAVLVIAKIARETSPTLPPPTHVSNIFDGRVEIERDTGRIRTLLESSPLSHNIILEPPGYLGVSFRDQGPLIDNEELCQLLGWLRNQGLPFSVGKGWGPAEVMHDLWSHGRVRGAFKTIYWTGPGKWHISDRYPGAA